VYLEVVAGILVVIVIVIIVYFVWAYTKKRHNRSTDLLQNEPKVYDSSVEVSSRELYEEGFEKESGHQPAFEQPNEKPEWEKESEEEV